MDSVECPKCALRFEPDEESTRDSIFCPQCGHEFGAEDECQSAVTAGQGQ